MIFFKKPVPEGTQLIGFRGTLGAREIHFSIGTRTSIVMQNLALAH